MQYVIKQYLFVSNIALASVCVTFAFVFFWLPLPRDKGANNYKASLYILASSYATIGLLNIIELLPHVSMVDIISSHFLVISSSQVILFSLSLDNILNPRRITGKYVARQCIPLIIFIVLHAVIVPVFGYPVLHDRGQWLKEALHPTVLLREIFLVFYVGQIVYYTRMLLRDKNVYIDKVDDYCADTVEFKLKWIKYSIATAVFIGITAVVVSLLANDVVNLIFNVSIIACYTVFALSFIQYSRVYQNIIRAFESDGSKPAPKKDNWPKLKKDIVDNRLFLKQGVTVEDLALTLKTGRTTLSSCINTEEGVNFNVWINRLRVEEAQSLLRQHPELPIAQIAEMVGYTEQSNFSRQFKIHTNLSPSVWKQQHLCLKTNITRQDNKDQDR